MLCHANAESLSVRCSDTLTLCLSLVGVPLVASVVTTATNVASGHTAFTLMVNPRSDAPKDSGARNIYAIFGADESLLTVPPAFHVASPFGADFAGTNPAFWQINADSQWDSWLTVGITQGDPHNLISSIGIDWTMWTADDGLSVDDGAVFWVRFLQSVADRPRRCWRSNLDPRVWCTDGSKQRPDVRRQSNGGRRGAGDRASDGIRRRSLRHHERSGQKPRRGR